MYVVDRYLIKLTTVFYKMYVNLFSRLLKSVSNGPLSTLQGYPDPKHWIHRDYRIQKLWFRTEIDSSQVNRF